MIRLLGVQGAAAAHTPMKLWAATIGPRAGLLHTTAAAAARPPAPGPVLATGDPTLPGQTLTFIQKAKGYLAFYKQGARTLWQNGRAVSEIRRRLGTGELVTRAEFQIVQRHAGDRLRLIPFGVLLVVLPKAIPSTCITYAQAVKMAAKHDARRHGLHREALRRIEAAGLAAQDFTTVAALHSTAARGNALFALDGLGRADLRLLCRFLGAGGPAAGLRAAWLRARLQQHLERIAVDDALLAREGLLPQLGSVELHRACQERGIPSAHVPEEQLRKALGAWIELTQTAGPSTGMLPIAWSRLVLLGATVKR